jgi:hypothetical protein
MVQFAAVSFIRPGSGNLTDENKVFRDLVNRKRSHDFSFHSLHQFMRRMVTGDRQKIDRVVRGSMAEMVLPVSQPQESD